MSHLERMVAHLEWADREVLASLRQAGSGHSTLVTEYAHLLAAEHVWHARLSTTPPEVPVWPRLSLDQCGQLASRNHAELRRFVAALGPEDPARAITYRNSAGLEFISTIEDILLHLCLHGAYHRGKIAWGLRQAGAEPAPTDFIAFARGVPAATHTR